MNPYALTALVLLAIAASTQYFFGSKKNRVINSKLAKDLEDCIKPGTTNYVNIGGTIGYNFVLTLPAPWSKAKGTFTVNARHSLLYLPLSILLGIRDRFYINIFTKKKLTGEGHIVRASHLGKANIAGLDTMKSTDFISSGKKFHILWKNQKIENKLKKIFESIPESERLVHFCVYPETQTFFIYYLPKNGELKPLLNAILPLLPSFFEGQDN